MTPYGQKMMAAWDKKQRSIAFSDAAQGTRARPGDGSDRDDGEMESKRYINMLVSPLQFDADEAFRFSAQGQGLDSEVDAQGPGPGAIPLRVPMSSSNGAGSMTKAEPGTGTESGQAIYTAKGVGVSTVAAAPGQGLGPSSLLTAENMSPMDPPDYSASYLTYQQALDKSTAAMATTAFPVGEEEEEEEEEEEGEADEGGRNKVKGRGVGGHQLPVPAGEWVVESERLTAADHVALDLLDRTAAVAHRQRLKQGHGQGLGHPTPHTTKDTTRTALTGDRICFGVCCVVVYASPTSPHPFACPALCSLLSARSL